MTAEEKKNDRWGLGISLGIHAALLVLFIFLLAWKEPFPPMPEYGIEVNFGLVDAGSGDIQPTTPANSSPAEVEDAAPEEPAPAEEEVVQEPSPEVVEEVTEPEVQEVQETTPAQTSEETQPQPNVVPAKEEPKEEKVVEKPVEKPTPQTNPAASYPNRQSTTDGASGTEGDSREANRSNQGDQPGETGDQGNPEGKVDARALYGNPGGGGGAALDMAGWNWDFLPKPNDVSNETGHIVFEIKIDDEGEILSVRAIEKSVSDPVVRIYQSEVRKLTFSPTSGNSRPAPTSTGRITFIIKSR